MRVPTKKHVKIKREWRWQEKREEKKIYISYKILIDLKDNIFNFTFSMKDLIIIFWQ